MSGETQNYCGWIMAGPDSDYSEALYLVDHRTARLREPLAKLVYEDTSYGRKLVTINYHITDQPFSEEELTAMVVAKMCGVSFEGRMEAHYMHRYSELTGYLWTDESLKVGGHDVVAELRSYLGKWCHMTITFHAKA